MIVIQVTMGWRYLRETDPSIEVPQLTRVRQQPMREFERQRAALANRGGALRNNGRMEWWEGGIWVNDEDEKKTAIECCKCDCREDITSPRTLPAFAFTIACHLNGDESLFSLPQRLPCILSPPILVHSHTAPAWRTDDSHGRASPGWPRPTCPKTRRE